VLPTIYKTFILIIATLLFIYLSTVNIEYFINRASDFKLNILAWIIELTLVFLLLYLPITKIKHIK
jgi:hypothetical protein